jgi:ubiquinone/menaquinone biosynthesis C-methylase UbiE
LAQRDTTHWRAWATIRRVTKMVSRGAFAGRAKSAVVSRLRPAGDREGYFERLAPSYDDWWTRTGRMANTEPLRKGWKEEVETLVARIRALEPTRTLDVGCGTGFLTRWLPGLVVGLDASEAMLDLARRQAPEAIFVRGDVLSLPFPDASFRRLFASHIYGHLNGGERKLFLREARRVAAELVIVDTASKRGDLEGAVQLRGLADGSRWQVFKQPFTAARLATELGGGDVLHDGDYFVMVRAAAP